MSNSASVDDLPPDSFRDEIWCELMPWLSQYSAGTVTELTHLSPAADWWLTESPAVSSTVVAISQISRAVAQLAVSDMGGAPLSQVVPGLSGATRIEALRLGSRAMTTLERLPAESVHDLGTASVGDLFAVRGTGIGTVVEIVESLVTTVVLRSSKRESTAQAAGAGEVLTAAERQLLEDLRQLSSWRSLRGENDRPLLGHLDIEQLAPEEVQETVQRLASLTASDFSYDDVVARVTENLSALAGALDERQLVVLRDRFVAVEPRTLAELGDQFGVSRERARQIESAAKKHVTEAFQDRAVSSLLASMRVEIQPVCALPRLVARHPELAQEVPAFGVPLWLVLDRLDDYFEVTDGWAAAPDVHHARERTHELLEDFADGYGVANLTNVSLGSRMSADELRQWLVWCGYQVMDDLVLTKTRNAADHAAGILSAAGGPLELEDIVERMQSSRNVRAVSNALGADERFARTDRSTWALASWGVETYTSIRDQVVRAVDASGGGVPLEVLVNDLTSRFRVSPKSVVTYASSGDFEVRDGVVRRREAGFSPPQRSPSETRRLFHTDVGWAYRLTVNHDHLRGSGFAVPSGVGAAAGCPPGATIELASRLGSQSVRWTGNQPACGTIRRFLQELGTAEGEQVWLEFRSDGRFEVRPGPTPETPRDGLEAALALVGAPEDTAVERATPALALSVDLPADAPPRRILRAFRDRGEDDVVALLEQAWVPRQPT